jgi:O-antigen ligase
MLALSLLPFAMAAAIIAIGRPTQSNLKLLAVLLPLEAFASIEAGFTIPLSYLLLVTILLATFLRGESWPAGYPGCKLILIYWGVVIVSTAIAAVGPSLGVFQIDENMTTRAGLLRNPLQVALIIFHFSLYFIIVGNVKTAPDADSLLKVHLWMGFILICLGLYQVAAFALNLPFKDITWSINPFGTATLWNYGEVRYYTARVTNFSPRATFAESLHFAYYLVSVVPISFALWVSRSGELRQRFAIVSSPIPAILGAVVLFLTMSRSGWVALALSLVIVALWLSPRLLFVHIPVATVAAGLATLLLAKTGFFAISSNSLMSIVGSRMNAADIVMDPRMSYLGVLWDIFRSHPILGVGAGNYGPLAASSIGLSTLLSAHGLLWAALAEFGIIGFMLLGLIFVKILWRLQGSIRAIKRSPRQAVMIGIFASLCGVIFQSFFLGDRPPFHLIFLLGLAAVYSSRDVEKNDLIAT